LSSTVNGGWFVAMHRTDPADTGPTRQPSGDLGSLLDAESRFEERLADARKRADEIVERARRAAEQAEHISSATLESESRRLHERIAAETAERIAALRDEAARDLVRLRGIDDRTRQRLVNLVLERLLADLVDPAIEVSP
jgi:hypothetical protein